MKVQNDNTAAIGGEPRFTGWCLERHDLCVAKLVALREKDTNFVAALIEARLVDPEVIHGRLEHLDPNTGQPLTGHEHGSQPRCHSDGGLAAQNTLLGDVTR